MWITNSLQADWMCLLANTSDGAPHKNQTLICVPMDTKGVVKAQKIRKIGMMSSDTGLIHFDDVRVPQRYRIGEEGFGFTYQMQQFQEERLWAASSAIEGLMRTLHDTIEYVRERRMFGQTVLDFQYVHFRLAELKTEIEALRALTYSACERYVAGEDVTEFASMAKLKAGRLKREVTDACLQYWGGMGYTWDNPVSRAFRDGRLMSIGGGADEVMLGIICKGVQVPGTPFATPPEELNKLAGYWTDVNKSRAEARRLLKEAGVPEGFSFTFKNRGIPMPYEPLGVWLIDQWRQVGLNVKQEVIEPAAYFGVIRKGDAEVFMDFQCGYIVEPDLDMYKFLSSDRNPANYGRYTDRELDALYEKQGRATSVEERKKLIRAFEKRLLDEEAHYLMTLQWHRIIPHSSKVKGWQVTPSHYLNNTLDVVWLSE
jgi:hypothetical protein